MTTVLVVTPEVPVGRAITAHLERAGHAVTHVASPEEALRATEPEILIADLELSGPGGEGPESGFELLAALRTLGASPKTILYSSGPTVDVFRRAAVMGDVQILLKPVHLDRLQSAVRDFAGTHDETFEEDAESEEPRLEAGYVSAPDCVELCARDIAAFCLRVGIGPSGRCRIATAVAEIVENARRHGYADRVGTIAMSAVVEDRDTRVVIHDLGRGFESSQVVADALMRREGGFARAASLAEDLRVESRPGDGTRVELTFSAFPVKFDEEDYVDLSELDYFGPELAKKVLSFLEDEDGESPFRLSPALAVTVGRLLAGPEQGRAQKNALWS